MVTSEGFVSCEVRDISSAGAEDERPRSGRAPPAASRRSASSPRARHAPRTGDPAGAGSLPPLVEETFGPPGRRGSGRRPLRPRRFRGPPRLIRPVPHEHHPARPSLGLGPIRRLAGLALSRSSSVSGRGRVLGLPPSLPNCGPQRPSACNRRRNLRGEASLLAPPPPVAFPKKGFGVCPMFAPRPRERENPAWRAGFSSPRWAILGSSGFRPRTVRARRLHRLRHCARLRGDVDGGASPASEGEEAAGRLS